MWWTNEIFIKKKEITKGKEGISLKERFNSGVRAVKRKDKEEASKTADRLTNKDYNKSIAGNESKVTHVSTPGYPIQRIAAFIDGFVNYKPEHKNEKFTEYKGKIR